jgi:hypothetical protein
MPKISDEMAQTVLEAVRMATRRLHPTDNWMAYYGKTQSAVDSVLYMIVPQWNDTTFANGHAEVILVSPADEERIMLLFRGLVLESSFNKYKAELEEFVYGFGGLEDASKFAVLAEMVGDCRRYALMATLRYDADTSVQYIADGLEEFARLSEEVGGAMDALEDGDVTKLEELVEKYPYIKE